MNSLQNFEYFEYKHIVFGAGQFSLGTLVGGRPGTTIFQNPGGGGGRIQGPGPAAPPGRLPKRLGAVNVGYKCHWSWPSPSGGQQLGIGWGPWRGVTSPPSNASLPGPAGAGLQSYVRAWSVLRAREPCRDRRSSVSSSAIDSRRRCRSRFRNDTAEIPRTALRSAAGDGGVPGSDGSSSSPRTGSRVNPDGGRASSASPWGQAGSASAGSSDGSSLLSLWGLSGVARPGRARLRLRVWAKRPERTLLGARGLSRGLPESGRCRPGVGPPGDGGRFSADGKRGMVMLRDGECRGGAAAGPTAGALGARPSSLSSSSSSHGRAECTP